MSINPSVKRCYESVLVSYLNPSFPIYYTFFFKSINLSIYGHLNVIKKKKRVIQSYESLCGLVIRSHGALLEVSVTYSFKIHQNDDFQIYAQTE